MSTDPFASQDERNEARTTLLGLDSHLAVLASLAGKPGFEWTADELATFPAPGDDARPVQVRLAQWAATHAQDLSEIHRLATGESVQDVELRRGMRLAEQVLASVLGRPVEEVAARLRSEAGAGLRTPISVTGNPEEPRVAEAVTLRPRNEHFQRTKDKGDNETWMDRILDPSDSWWEKGALVADQEGPALFDADGQRHPFPETTQGGYLVESSVGVEAGAPGGSLPRRSLFVAAPDGLGRRVLLVLPPQGFGGDLDGRMELARFARRAGLELVLRTYGSGRQDQEFPGMREAPNLEDAIHDRATRERSPMSRLHRAGQRVTRRFGGLPRNGSP